MSALTLPYDLWVIAILAFVWLTPPDWLGDPTATGAGPDRMDLVIHPAEALIRQRHTASVRSSACSSGSPSALLQWILAGHPARCRKTGGATGFNRLLPPVPAAGGLCRIRVKRELLHAPVERGSATYSSFSDGRRRSRESTRTASVVCPPCPAPRGSSHPGSACRCGPCDASRRYSMVDLIRARRDADRPRRAGQLGGAGVRGSAGCRSPDARRE